jgi:RelE toxin of RelEB toxin-antitoxin system
LIKNPDSGDLIPGSGGVRKMRWRAQGRGKRGGVRIIYYARIREGQIWMLTIYAKNVTENIPANILRRIKEEIDA